MAFNALPIRWRLNIWYLALLAAMLVLFSGMLYFGLKYFLYRSLDDTLENQAALLTESIDIEDGRPAIGDRRIRNRPGQQFVRLVGHDGELLTDSSRFLEDVPMNDPGLRLALNGQQDFRWLEVHDERMRVLSQPVIRDGEVIAVVQVGVTGRTAESILRQTLILIALGGAVIVSLSSLGGVWLAGRALAPIDRMTRLAGNIGDRDLSQRIDLPRSDDEVGRLAGTFNAMLDRLESAFQRQRQFTAAASHELRTPLALMQSQIEVALSQNRDADEDTQVLESLGTDVRRLARISDALLALARGDAGELELTKDSVDLQGLLELVSEQYVPLAESLGIEIEERAEPVTVVADEDRLIQLLVNLVENAVQHTPSGRKIALRCDADERSATVCVEDEGVGIEPKHLAHIFERFYRIDAARGRSNGGAGLGLSISKMIVEAHGGSIDVSSYPGEGTSFTVTLPRGG
jgi:heavy metal sensor kinase